MDLSLASYFDLLLYSLSMWYVIIPAVLAGVLMGAIPGFSAANTIIMLLPLTLVLDVHVALTFMVALYCASQLGGGIPAILLNIPGTGGAAATMLDGHPMAQRGLASKALALSFTASVIGGLLTSLITLASLPLLSHIGYYVHSPELVVVMLFGLALIAAIAADDMLKGLIAGALGLLLGAMGADHIYATPRGTFGLLSLFDGVPLVPALIGLFAISEAFIMLEQGKGAVAGDNKDVVTPSWSRALHDVLACFRHWWLILRSSVLGLVIGVLPGAGAPIAAFVAYQQARAFSKTPEKFGTGAEEGIIAPEAANNGVTTGAMVPLLALGIPGGETAAVMMVVLQFQGIPFGPRLFVQDPTLAYGVIMSMFVAYVFMLVMIFPLTRYLSRITLIPNYYMAPLIVAFTLVGAFVPRGFMDDIAIAVVFGIIGYIARKTGYHVAAILIGVILGPLIEKSFILSMRLSGNDVGVFFSSPITIILWAMLAATLIVPLLLKKRRQRNDRRAGLQY
ncbi:tripartite tricarboxylate transporter permease [Hoeflea sp. G2-23]|uniref:Tripartite tricarboxylate transporter permease n=1 Tax=Hoeflea algicola TaxID=2983763 RepID=A0ABT3Z904_9HYPH|nr:tripartite tricarboxylate transporter permease [Hoeflea algicola]MCY0148171.1 tripartite tricarboxylate transporter permease [Hoeflea algicola]